MQCVNCGANNESTSKYCEYCGSPLSEEKATVYVFNNYYGKKGDEADSEQSGEHGAQSGVPPYRDTYADGSRGTYQGYTAEEWANLNWFDRLWLMFLNSLRAPFRWIRNSRSLRILLVLLGLSLLTRDATRPAFLVPFVIFIVVGLIRHFQRKNNEQGHKKK
ncbi:MAG: zinc ribbon domain-containing protein [Clostridiaceae bacterium]|nr:zinc ribbon domain-containing protein [Clostridiaceae bacterium]